LGRARQNPPRPKKQSPKAAEESTAKHTCQAAAAGRFRRFAHANVQLPPCGLAIIIEVTMAFESFVARLLAQTGKWKST
jgi:hypothetical protein